MIVYPNNNNFNNVSGSYHRMTLQADKVNNVLKNAPHTAAVVTADRWDRPYTRQQAAWPARWLHEHKFWPPVSRIDNVFGDRNPMCSCPPMDSYV